MMWRTTNVLPAGSCPGQSCMALASATDWFGPYHWNPENIFKNETIHIEDAHIWQSPQDSSNPGSFHAIFHSDVEGSSGGAAGNPNNTDNFYDKSLYGNLT